LITPHNPLYFSEKFSFPTPSVFVDRDGVINKEVNLLHKMEDFELIPGSLEAIKKLNDNNIPIIIISNQTVVARGMAFEEFVHEVNQKTIDGLKAIGGKVDAVLYCPHSPKADVEEYRDDCPWRKPKPGMIVDASAHLNLNISKSWMVGDAARDILAGQAAGTKTILVETGHSGQDELYDAKPDFVCADLAKAVELIVEKK